MSPATYPSVEIAAPIKPGTKSLDLFIRAVRGAATANNFFGWVKMDGLRLDVDA